MNIDFSKPTKQIIVMSIFAAVAVLGILSSNAPAENLQNLNEMITSKTIQGKNLGANACPTCTKYMNGTLGGGNSTEKIGGITIQKPKKMETPKYSRQNKLAEKSHEAYQKNTVQKENIKIYEDNIWTDLQKSFGISDEQMLPKKDVENFAKANKSGSTYDENYLFLFISKSVPLATLKNYAEIFNQNPHITFVMRGTVGSPDKILPTIEWIRSFQCPDGQEHPDKCFSVKTDLNPALFEKFSINKVPALVYFSNPQALMVGEDISNDDYLVYYGDVDPSYVIDRFQIAKSGDEKLIMLKSRFLNSSYYQTK
jgi:type-F conjugative transfer system pilin assembly protein TrbC